MSHFDGHSSHQVDSRSSFAIHEDHQGSKVDDSKANFSTQVALPLSNSRSSNIQRDISVSTADKNLQRVSPEGRSSNIGDETHKSLLKALEEHCNMGPRLSYADDSQIPDEEKENYIENHCKMQDTKENSVPQTQRSAESAAKGGAALNARDKEGLPNEVEQLKLELEAAKQKIATQEQELTVARTSSITPSIGLFAPEERNKADNVMDMNILGLGNDVSSFDLAESVKQQSAVTLASNIGSHLPTLPPQGLLGSNSYDYSVNSTPFSQATTVWNEPITRNWNGRYQGATFPPFEHPSQHVLGYRERGVSRPASPVARAKRSPFNECESGMTNVSRKSSAQFPKWTVGQTTDSGREAWDIGPANDLYNSMGYEHVFPSPASYQQSSTFGSRSIGTALSPTAHEFTATGAVGPWNAAPTSPVQTYVPTTEPLNYRRLLDRSVSCNWKYIVDKIVCNNDQQASIFLQQKLKIGTVEQKYEIVEAIVAQAYPLMVNRFGNFLVQRCFEHGTPDQVIAIANAIRGNTLNLSMDAFGCHVVQKAFDAVPEEYKAIMVHELLRRIPETVIHRYACHVWQKLFELRWSDSPPQIMKHVNEALRGMWHEVALGETGSLVVQNIFENCLEEDKRPCINEVLKSIDIIAHGQFGNWCIQHICEHGAPADRSRAVDHVICYASEYSMDQFASKVVEKCLKIGGSDFLERYLERVCEGRADRPRIPLIDIASDQYGNYLIQYILTHANGNHREIVASHIRKHMVSLRGSKFGSRVGMLCSNPAYATRPGPGVGPSTSRLSANTPVPRFQGHYR